MQIGFDIFLQTGQKNRIDIVFILAMVMNLKDKFSNETGLLDLNENKQLNRNTRKYCARVGWSISLVSLLVC